MKAFGTEQRTSTTPPRRDAADQVGVERALGSSQERLHPRVATQMAAHLGHDFSQVRVHHDESAAQSAVALGADAYTIGNHIVFGRARYDPESAPGWYLLAHELAHVVQQRGAVVPGKQPFIAGFEDALEQDADRGADSVGESAVTRDPNRPSALGMRARGERPSVGTASRMIVQRQKAGKTKPKTPAAKPKALPKKPVTEWTFGQTSFTKQARDAVLRGGALLPGADNEHVALRSDGSLGYDPDYVDPTDPFRWDRVKFIVDSGAKVRVDLVSIIDEFKVLVVRDGKSETVSTSLRQAAAAGLTLPTVAIVRALQPEGTVIASTNSDTNQVFFSTDIGDPSTSSLAHELFGHLYLALKGVPFTHPKKPEEIAKRGTLSEKHGIKDPLGGTYKGTVKEFIDLYVGSESFSALKSPTQFVSLNQLRSALKSFKTDFGTKASGKLNGPWGVPESLDLSWEIISANYAVAETADPKLLTSIENELAEWYGTLTSDQQYVLTNFLTKVRFDFLRRTKLASALLGKIKPPAGMRFPEQ